MRTETSKQMTYRICS